MKKYSAKWMCFVILIYFLMNSSESFQNEKPEVNRDHNVTIPSANDPPSINNTEEENATYFLDNLLNGYDQRIRPHHKRDRVNVSVGMFVNTLYGINEQNMDYRVDIFLRSRWNDPRLAFSDYPEDAIALHPSLLAGIWKPDLFFANEKHASFHDVTTENKLLRIYKNGDVKSSIRLSLTLSCAMYLENFPMDTQVCKMQLESFGYNMNDVAFNWKEKTPVQLPETLALPQFKILGYKLDNCTKMYSTGYFTCIEVAFIFKREMGYYVIQTYVPSTLIVILSWVSFWINMDAAPARTALGITTVLTLTTQSAGARTSLPKVSYVKAIDVWLAVCLLFVFAALLEFAAVNFLSRQETRLIKLNTDWIMKQKIFNGNRKKDDQNVGLRKRCVNDNKEEIIDDIDAEIGTQYCIVGQMPLNSENEAKKSKSLAKKYRQKAQTIDTISRVMFPSIFLIFNIFYWVRYKIVNNEMGKYLEGATLHEE